MTHSSHNSSSSRGSASGSRNNSSNSTASTAWQDKLEEACREYQFGNPVFQIVSDRRGGRTAWSSRVTIQGSSFTARFWYDGKNLNNAKEDAAEVALTYLANSS